MKRVFIALIIIALLASPAWGGLYFRTTSSGSASFPDQSGHAGEFLQTDGSAVSWVAVPGGGDVLIANNLSEFTATQATARSNIGAAAAADLSAHMGNTSNPHSVTAAQVGAATSADLSAHTGDTNNPHSVTAAQAGAEPAGAVSTHEAAADPHPGYLREIDIVSQAEAEAGTATTARAWTAERARQTVQAWAPGSVIAYLTDCSGVTAGFCFDTDDDELWFWNGTAMVELNPSIGITSVGFITRTGSGTADARTLQDTPNQIAITNPDGVAGDPVFSLPAQTQTPRSLTGADGSFSGPPLNDLNAGETITRGALVYVDEVDGELYLADKASATTLARYVALDDGTDGNPIRVTRTGNMVDSSWSWTRNGNLYLDSSGGLTQTATTTSGEILQLVGFAPTPTSWEIVVSMIYFEVE